MESLLSQPIDYDHNLKADKILLILLNVPEERIGPSPTGN